MQRQVDVPHASRDPSALVTTTASATALARLERVLVIEDDADIARMLELHLRDMHATVTRCNDGMEGLQRALAESWSLVVLDLSLPQLDGLEICARLRRQNRLTPVLMLTARSAEHDRVVGLDTGADDYLTKPFSIAEFLARVRAQLRRFRAVQSASFEPSIVIGQIVVDTERRTVCRDNVDISLTSRELDLLVFLMRNAGRVYSRAQLLNCVWGLSSEAYEHTVSSHINRLRTKLEPDPAVPRYLLTVWGVGYRFAEH